MKEMSTIKFPNRTEVYEIVDAAARLSINEKTAEAKAYADSAAAAVKDDLLNGAGEAYDTLKELGDLINENQDALEALETIATGKADQADLDAKSSVTIKHWTAADV